MYSSGKKNKNFMIIGIISIFLIVVAITVGIILYLKTDIFKSDEELFQRQFLQNIDVINKCTEISLETEYRKMLEENSFNETTELGLKYNNNEGKEDKFTGNITGINNKENNLAYKDINIDFETTNVVKITYLKENNIYGIRFIEGTKFAVIDMSNDITAVLKYFGIEDVVNSGKINTVNLSDVLNLSNEEIEQLESQYLSIMLQNITKQNYSSQKDRMITLDNGESVVTNSYILSINEKQLETIYNNILEQLSKDEIILGKLDNIDTKIKEMGINLNKSIKTQFIEQIDNKIKNIKVETGLTITVYELEGTTVRTTIQYGDKVIEIDINNANDITIDYSDVISGDIKSTNISIKKENDLLQISYEDYNNKKLEIIRQLNINNNDIKSVVNFKYANNDNIKDLEISTDRTIKLGEANEIPTSFEKSGKVLLNDYDEASTSKNLEALKKRIIKLLREKRDATNSELLNYIIQYNNQLEENEKTEEETKRKKFNSKFELYEGKNQEQSIVSNLLDEVGKNMSNYQMVGDSKVSIYIEEGKKNTDLITEIKNNIFKEDGKVYNIYMKYNQDAKINEIIIELAEPEEEQ